MEQTDPPFECPSIVSGYELVELLGTGSFSFVYKARQQQTEYEDDEFVAIKIIPKTKLCEDGDEERLQREVDTMTFLIHDSIVNLHNFFKDDTNYYLVMDFCPGGTVFTYMTAGNRIREPQAATIFRQIVEAIEFCHQRGVAHRDLKPQNILITSFPYIKVSDFGLCGYINDDTKMSTFCGSPCYSAPECLNHVDYDGKLSDIWSLGVILYELVTSSHPWNVANLPMMVQQITKAQYTIPAFVTSACADLIDSLLKPNVEERLDCESILAHPWMKIAAKKLPMTRNSNSLNNSSINMNIGSKSCLPPLKRMPSVYDGQLPEKRLFTDNAQIMPHSTINMITPCHSEMNPKPRASLGKSLGPAAQALLKRRTSYTKHALPNQEETPKQLHMQKKVYDSIDPTSLK